MSKQWMAAFAAGVILASAVGTAMAEAEKEKGYYVGGNAFYKQIFDADGTVTTTDAGGIPELGALPVIGDMLNGMLDGGAGGSANIDASYDMDFSYGATVGYKFERPYRVEFEYRQGENDIDRLSGPGVTTSGTGSLEVISMMGNLWYDFSAGEQLRPYVGFGLGLANLDFGDADDDVFIGQLGAGVTYYLTPRLAIDAGYRFSMSEDASYTSGATAIDIEYSAQSVVLGLRYNFFDAQYGVKDADADSVYDKEDQCPGTPLGVQVDSVGCPLDGDKDGVADYLDQCLSTPEGEEVNAVGCSLDGDRDGVANSDDECLDTPAGEAVMSNGCGGTLTLDGVNFELSSAKLTVNAETILNDVASTLNSSPSFSVELQGHTDSAGSATYNMNLSQNRAESVKNYLVGSGVSSDRLTATGYGQEQPVAANDTKDGRAKNRRVDMKVLASGAAMVAEPMMYVEPTFVEDTVMDEPIAEEVAVMDEPMVEEASAEEMMMDEPASEEEYQPYEMSEDEMDY
jgi:OOP family OmpA-OmpF porin